MNEIAASIQTLSLMSEKLEMFSNRERIYNTDYAFYLDQLAAEMYKMANELREINYMFGGV
jgi:hypothetical protein